MNAYLHLRPPVEFDRTNDTKPDRSSPPPPTVSVPVEVRDTETEIELYALLPGVEAENLNVCVTQNSVTLSGTGLYVLLDRPRQHVRDGHRTYTEFQTSAFHRQINLLVDIDRHHTHARLRDGRLTLTLPKQAKSPVVKVRVSAPSETTVTRDSEFTRDLWSDDAPVSL
ncbi:MAG: Hsp20/alpha crystallin family protein [Cyanobacteria bacterium SBC]|nr:Hsp20/alpha crystallin family protein [Cyanobacteria bacterium SBC]